MSADVKPDLVSVRDAAARYGVSYTTYRRGAAAGQFPPIVKIRGVSRVGVKAIDEHITQLTLAVPASHGSAAVVEAGSGRAGSSNPSDAGEQTPALPTTTGGTTCPD